MKRLVLKNNGAVIAEKLEVASSVFARMKGLLGRDHLAEDTALWIQRCRDIHTWFMRFPIDAVFVDENMTIKYIYADIGPWKVIWPRLGARDVIEMPSGRAGKFQLKVGDQLDVVA